MKSAEEKSDLYTHAHMTAIVVKDASQNVRATGVALFSVARVQVIVDNDPEIALRGDEKPEPQTSIRGRRTFAELYRQFAVSETE